MKIVLSKDEIIEYVKKELEQSFRVECIEFDENNEIIANVQPKKQSPYEEKWHPTHSGEKHQPGDTTKPRFKEGRDTMSSKRTNRDTNMPVF
jgi:hypothetical protein